MRFAIDFLQVLILVGTAPLLRGIIGRIKARIQNRRGASVWRPYADLRKLFSKEDLIPTTASPLFRLSPVILFAATVAAAAFVPTLHSFAMLGAAGDFIMLVYLLALARSPRLHSPARSLVRVARLKDCAYFMVSPSRITRRLAVQNRLVS